MTKKRKAKGFIDRFHRNMEKVVVKSRLFAKFLYYFNRKMTLDEFKMVDLPQNSKFLCIGCGSFPWTLLTLGKVKNWQFVGIDHDVEAVESAKKMVEYFDLSNKITLIAGDAQTFKISELFPAAFLSGSFDHIPDSERVTSFQNLNRHLTFGGNLVFDVYIGVRV